MRWLERVPTIDVAHWLHHQLKHVGAKTMWSVRKLWNIQMAKAQFRYRMLLKSALSVHRTLQTLDNPWELSQVFRGHIPLIQWQVDYIGPLPKAQGTVYTLIAVDTTFRLLFSWPCVAPDQRHNIQVLTHSCSFYG